MKVDIEKIKNIAREAGDKVIEIYNTDFSKEKKEDDSFITKADLSSQKIILEKLKEFNYPVLSEEKEDDLSRLDSDNLFIVDPLDGTKDFIEKTGAFSIMIGLARRGKPVLGVVYKPIGDKLYYGEKGKGSFLEEKGEKKELIVSPETSLDNSILVMSKFHLSKPEKKFIKKEMIKDVIHTGSIGVKVGLIAEGKAEGYINVSNKTRKWDTCAPEIILREARGNVTDLKGDKLEYNSKKINNENGVIASNGNIHFSLIEEIKKL